MSWKLLGPDKIIKTTELSDYTNTELYVPEELSGFFGSAGERLALIYNGREYPAYVETSGGNTKLKLSKVLIKKLDEAFPQYNSWFGDIKEPEKTPRLAITKESDHFIVRLLTGNKEPDINNDESSRKATENAGQQRSGLNELLKKWISGYPNYYPRDFRFSFKDVINEEIPGVLAGLEPIKSGNYTVQGFAGETQWTEIPWVMVTDKRIENSIESGLHLAYFLAMNSAKLYLAIVYAQRDAGRRTLAEKVNGLRQKVDTGSFKTNQQEIALPNAMLVSGTLCYREYSEDMPQNEVLEAEFEALRKIYDACVRSDSVQRDDTIEDQSSEDEKQQLEEPEEAVPVDRAESLLNELSNESDAEEKKEAPEIEPEIVKPVTAGAGIPFHEIDNEPDSAASADQEPEITMAAQTEALKNDFATVVALAEDIKRQQPHVAVTVNQNQEISRDENEKAEDEKGPEFGSDLKPYPLRNETLKPYLQLVLAKMANRGFIYSSELIKSYYLSLKSKPFVMIRGYVGSGKTSLPRLFAETIGANAENGRYVRVLVGKKWEDEKQLFGSLDSRGHFIPGPVMPILKSSKDHPEKPHFLLLDEMDQSPPEGYLRRLLEGINGNDEPFLTREDFGADVGAFREYGVLGFPDNLYIIGTINQGPESYPIEPRVIDSGNTLEMPAVEISAFPNFGSPVGESEWDNNQFKMLNNSQGLPEIIERLMVLLNELQNILVSFDHPIGYRGKNEILAFGINSGVEGLFSEQEVIDLAIVQRMLPILKQQPKMNQDVYRELACFGLKKEIRQRLLDEKSLTAFCRQLEALLKAKVLPCPRSGRQIIRILKNAIK